MSINCWELHREQLFEAYRRKLMTTASFVRMEIVTRGISQYVRDAVNLQVLDIGGGFGVQAVRLAQIGHFVTVLDSDKNALAAAQSVAEKQPLCIRQRMTFIEGEGEDEELFLDGHFDIVCAHSVLMYFSDPVPFLSNMVRMVRPGGFVSILSVNPFSTAMRTGMQGRWSEALETMRTGLPDPSRYKRTYNHDRRAILRTLRSVGAGPCRWWGVGIFSSHIEEEVYDDSERKALIELEWIASAREPYRSCAHCFHILARRHQ